MRAVDIRAGTFGAANILKLRGSAHRRFQDRVRNARVSASKWTNFRE